jgi:hypothetical protein
VSLLPRKRRLRSLATIATTNAVVIYTTLYSGWGLREATLAYVGELVALVLVVYARVITAKRLPHGTREPPTSRWKLLAAKLLAILTTLPMYTLFIGVLLLLLFYDGGDGNPADQLPWEALPEHTVRSLGICWLAFLISHLLAFIRLARSGKYDELISDGRVSVHLWRYPALLFAAVAVNGELVHGAVIAPWYFIAALALMAIIDTVLYVVEMDAVDSTIRESAAAPS